MSDIPLLPTKGNVISMGEYDPIFFQPTFFVLVGPTDRDFVLPV